MYDPDLPPEEIAERERRAAAREARKKFEADARNKYKRSLLKAIAAGLRDWLDPQLAALEQRLYKLQGIDARIRDLEAKMLTDGGIWDARTMYLRGNVVTHAGTIWVAREACANCVPGKSDVWRMMAKTHK